MPAPKDKTKYKEWKNKISKSRTGILTGSPSHEARRKMSEAKIGTKRSIEVRRKIGDANRGEKSHFWKGGVSKINRTERRNIMSTLEYRLWREAVFARDKHTCIWCGVKGVFLNADHIKPFAYFPELRFAIDNGRTLCVPCHRTTETYGGRTKLK